MSDLLFLSRCHSWRPHVYLCTCKLLSYNDLSLADSASSVQAQWKKAKPSALEAGSVMAYAIAQSIGLRSHMHAFRYEGVVLICTLRIVADSQEHLTDSSAQHMQFSYRIISNIGASPI